MDEYIRTFGSVGGLRGSFELYRTAAEDAAEFAPLYADKLKTPVLALAGDHSFGGRTEETFKQVADDVRGAVIERCSHFAPIERPGAVLEQVTQFLGAVACPERTHDT
jgi:pimeloyl-ACP methyl ester carboxylesterase